MGTKLPPPPSLFFLPSSIYTLCISDSFVALSIYAAPPQAYKPELILVSSGFDASFLDPLATMMLSSEHFRSIASKLQGVAKESCGGKIIFAHEVGR